MSFINRSDNGLIKFLAESDREQLLQSMEDIHLPRGMRISQVGRPMDYVYFLSSGIGSVMAVSETGLRAEAGMFGREGFAPTASSIGANSNPFEIIVQVEGHGHRLHIEDFQRIVAGNSSLANLLSRYIYVFAAQVSYTALANAAFKIDQRLARWILMCHDRLDVDDMPMTHEFMSLILAVRRPSVTTALHMLEGERLIRSERGRVIVRDRARLEQYAADCYGRPEKEYRALIETHRSN